MKELVVKSQQKMPFPWLYDICRESIVHRLMRSMVTVVIITLAIAFLSYIMVDSYIGSSIRDSVLAELRTLTCGTSFMREVSTTPSLYDLVRRIHASRNDASYMDNIRKRSELSDAALQSFLAKTELLNDYLTFFQSIPAGRAVILFETNQDMSVIEWLSKPDNRAVFKRNLADMPSLRIPGGIEGFESFMQEWPELEKTLQLIRTNHQRAVVDVKGKLPESSLLKSVVTCKSDAEKKALFAMLAKDGFKVNDSNVPYILAEINYEKDLAKALKLLKSQKIRAGWFRRFQERFSPKDALSKCCSDNQYVEWVYENCEPENRDLIAKGQFIVTASRYTRLQELLQARLTLTSRYGLVGALNKRAMWLIIVSFMVCAVGIANAMLMSVLERFKEIATMKCLGARNETIGVMFIVESTFVGVIGGSVGMVIGLLIGGGRQVFSYGFMVFRNFPVGSILWVMLASFGCSLLLALFAAIYPAIVASRMAPMEAMRVD